MTIEHSFNKKQKKMKGRPWRLVYYQGKVVAVVEGFDSNETVLPDHYFAEEFEHEHQLINRIESLGLWNQQ